MTLLAQSSIVNAKSPPSKLPKKAIVKVEDPQDEVVLGNYLKQCEIQKSDNDALQEALQKAEMGITPWYKTDEVLIFTGLALLASGFFIGQGAKN